jgi:hypothetical protein
VQVPGEGDGLFYASHDVSDCFYQMRLPRHLSRLFALRSVAARDVGITTIDGREVSPDQAIFPLIDVLPMGFSFALHWAQKVHETVLERAGIIPRSESLLVDFRAPPDLADSVGQIVYVDNGIFLGN